MTTLDVQVDPEAVGLDPERLSRIAPHFDAHVKHGHFAGWLSAIGRDGQVAWVGHGGLRHEADDLAVTTDTIWRIYSMTKPVTSLAAMMLFEEGRFDLNDEVATWLPEFAAPEVYLEGDVEHPVTRPASGPIRVWHLLTHTAGLTYGFQHCHPVDAIYRHRGFEFGPRKGIDLAGAVEQFAAMPLVFDPGTAWNYSVATDVVGRLIEVWGEMPLDEFFATRIFEPLGMTDTGFFCPESSLDRLAELYVNGGGEAYRAGGAMSVAATRPPAMLSGGGGLVSTAHDYHRFATMLLQGGALGDVRLVAPSTIALMSTNFLPGGADLEALAQDSFSEVSMSGVGFGLGLSCVIDQARNRMPTSEGTVSWGGAASTTFWVDQAEDLTVVFFTQLLPSSTYPIRRELQRLVYQSIVD
ncbi:MAG TPA: serine hydrolase domain-containing protein [Acidimicrobiales bacterium]|jgi:CubicO group peptidase (beta-lactamase class C family)|nr:serine hydrolase domain-containing protein [Acidimicrobiales bacterium]